MTTFSLTVDVWRQTSPDEPGRLVTYRVPDADAEMTVLELLDRINAGLEAAGETPVVFDDGCREGVCGKCGVTVDGVAHGPERNAASCMQHLGAYRDGDRVRIEPLQAASLPVKQDLSVDKKALRRVAKAGKFPVAMKALANGGCISCGACISSCPNGSGQLFVGTMLRELPPLATSDDERRERSAKVIEAAEDEFGPCSLLGDCVEVCPAGLPLENLSAVARENLRHRFPRLYRDTPTDR
ncbi:2Fe-2S iron-sulfur cluster-binding protein [Kocuria sp. M1R5S2]|uniref:2Fe-2S iron-sulfur cluster-binding protein n=1 Tax=Kocuria rhizosphaerae TaxID=3376285 RepID=UPI00378F4F77